MFRVITSAVVCCGLVGCGNKPPSTSMPVPPPGTRMTVNPAIVHPPPSKQRSPIAEKVKADDLYESFRSDPQAAVQRWANKRLQIEIAATWMILDIEKIKMPDNRYLLYLNFDLESKVQREDNPKKIEFWFPGGAEGKIVLENKVREYAEQQKYGQLSRLWVAGDVQLSRTTTNKNFLLIEDAELLSPSQ